MAASVMEDCAGVDSLAVSEHGLEETNEEEHIRPGSCRAISGFLKRNK